MEIIQEPERNEPPGTGLPTLENAREMVCDQINEFKRGYLSGGYFTHAGHHWNINDTSKLDILGYIVDVQLGGDPPTAWRNFDNQFIPVTVAELGDIGKATALFVKRCNEAGWAHKANVGTLTDVVAVLAYDFTAGWPSRDEQIA